MSDPTVVTDKSSFRETVRDALDAVRTDECESGLRGRVEATAVRVPVEVRVRVADPFEAYRRARDGPGGFYLATTGGPSGWGYFGVEPAERVTAREEAAALDDEAVGSSLAALGGLIDGERLIRDECDVPYPCGLFGWLSYDLVRELENLPDSAVDDRGFPRLEFGLYDCVAAWEEPRGDETTLRVTACPQIADVEEADRAYEQGREAASELARAATEGDAGVGDPPVDAETAAFESECGRDEYAERVRRVKEHVRDGETFQANVSQRLVAPAAVHPVEAFDALRRVNPAPYSGLLEFPSTDLVSASPELLLDLDGDRAVTEPIAGTRPRGATPEADEDLEADLLGDEKERAEHAMLVDLERNDLGKVCAYGSVEVSDYRRVDRYSEVMHLVSEVEGRLRRDAGLADAIAATFPGGTITGAPKPRTMEIIDELEDTRRGPYTGSIAALGFDGRATLNIVIRTLVRSGEEYHLRVGAGIVHDSMPEREYEETLAKARALVNALDEALDADRDLSVK